MNILRKIMIFSIVAIITCASFLPIITGEDYKRHNKETISILDGLISNWKFDEGDGSLAYDSIGTNNGDIFGKPQWVNGRNNSALLLDGIDDFVNCGNDLSLDIGNDDFTIAAWIKMDSTPLYDFTGIVAKGGYTEQDQYFVEGYGLFYYSPKDKLAFWMSNGTSRIYPGSEDNLGLIENDWNFITVTIDRDHTAEFYVNALKFGSYDISEYNNEDIVNSNTDFYIGLWKDFQTCFKGFIDEVKIYNRVLHENEVLSLYHEFDNTPPEVKIIKPREGFIYRKNQQIFPFPSTIIFGEIEVLIEVTDPDGINDSSVRLYVDGNDYGWATYDPLEKYYSIWFDETLFKTCTLKAKGCDLKGSCKFSEEISVFYLNIGK